MPPTSSIGFRMGNHNNNYEVESYENSLAWEMWRSTAVIKHSLARSLGYCTIFRRFAIVFLKISIFFLGWNGCTTAQTWRVHRVSLFRVLVDHVYRFRIRRKWRRFSLLFSFLFFLFSFGSLFIFAGGIRCARFFHFVDFFVFLSLF